MKSSWTGVMVLCLLAGTLLPGTSEAWGLGGTQPLNGWHGHRVAPRLRLLVEEPVGLGEFPEGAQSPGTGGDLSTSQTPEAGDLPAGHESTGGVADTSASQAPEADSSGQAESEPPVKARAEFSPLLRGLATTVAGTGLTAGLTLLGTGLAQLFCQAFFPVRDSGGPFTITADELRSLLCMLAVEIPVPLMGFLSGLIAGVAGVGVLMGGDGNVGGVLGGAVVGFLLSMPIVAGMRNGFTAFTELKLGPYELTLPTVQLMLRVIPSMVLGAVITYELMFFKRADRGQKSSPRIAPLLAPTAGGLVVGLAGNF